MAQTRPFKIRRKDSDRVVSDNLIPKEELKIGSQQVDIDLILNHPAVSPVHAMIREVDGRPWIFDVLDANATLLNGNSISSAPLLDGSEVQIGPFSLRVQVTPDLIVITVERGLKAAVKPPAKVAGAKGEPEQGDEVGEDEQKALDIIWQDRKREASKIAISTPLYPIGIYGKGKARFNWTSTGDLKPPIRRKVWLKWVVTTVALASIGALFSCTDVYSPGPLASAHSSSATLSRGIALSTVSSCSECHHLLGNKERDCTDCHNVPPSSSASSPGFDPKISDAHRDANIGCAGCHSEHSGSDFPIKEVDNRSCTSCHNETFKFRGKVLGAPHKGSAAKSNTDSPERPGVGYIRDADGVLTWNKQRGKEAVTLFHLEHPYTQKCNYCHQPGAFRTEEWEKSPRASCQACHAVSFDVSGLKAIGPNCTTCHKQHGQDKGLKLAIGRISEGDLRKSIDQVRSNGLYSLGGDTTDQIKPPEIGGASVIRQGRVNWSWTLASKLGLAPWHIWTASVGIFALGGTLLVGFGNIRRSRLLRVESERRRIKRDTQADQETETGGYPKRPPPAYTFPIIDPDRCIGCYACIEACPHDVLTMSDKNIAMPIAPAQCMDDTKCQTACPTQACIVASTGKTIPEEPRPDRSHDTYMTKVPGLYVIGDVAKIPLIKYAIVEGASVIDHIEKTLKEEAKNTAVQYDAAIIGAGPAGLSAALRAVEKHLTYIVIERDQALATIVGYPTAKNVNLKTEGDEPRGLLPLPIQDQRRKEEILAYWTDLIARNQIKINDHENCVNIEEGDGCFTVTIEEAEGRETVTYTSRKVVLAMGSCDVMTLNVKGVELTIPIERSATKCQNCGAPRQPNQEVCSSCNLKIDESSTEICRDAKVKYKLGNAASYDGKRCVVVGGGNSAVEAAVKLTGFKPRLPEATFTLNSHVTLVVRSHFTPDLKFVNKMELYECLDAGRIDLRLWTEIKEIREDQVILMNKKKEEIGRIPNDYVFCYIGTQWPESFLEKLKIRILNKKEKKKKCNRAPC